MVGRPVSTLDVHPVHCLTTHHNNHRKFSGASLPPVMGLREGQSQWVTVYADAVLDVIKEEAKRFR